MEVNGNAEHHANIPEWGLEDLTGSVLYDAFYESTTMLAGRMLAQQRLAAARGDRDGERRAETDRRGLLAARGKVDPTDRETLIRLKRENDSARAARTEAVAPWHAIGGSLAVDVEGIWRDDIRPVVDAAERWIGNGVLDRFLEDESLFGEFLRTPVSEGGVESLVVGPPHIVVEVGA